MKMFSNTQIPVESLPSVKEVAFIPLNPKYLRVGYISIFLLFIPVLLIGVGMLIFLQHPLPLVLEVAVVLAWCFLFLAEVVVLNLGFPKKGYSLREKDVVFKTGLLWHKVFVVPFNRVQHCELKQGPLEKNYGLWKLKVYTAGGHQSDITIPGLTLDEGQRIKDFIINKTAQDGTH